jgi:hypothetical protein
MLNIDPSGRPNISEVIFHLENIAQTKSFQLSENLTFLKKTESLLNTNNSNLTNTANQLGSMISNTLQQGGSTFYTNNNNSNNNQANSNNSAPQSGSNWMGNASSIFKGNSLLKTIKDASTKVMDTVHK